MYSSFPNKGILIFACMISREDLSSIKFSVGWVINSSRNSQRLTWVPSICILQCRASPSPSSSKLQIAERHTERHREALNQLWLQQALILGCTRASASSIYRSCKLLQLIYKVVANCQLHDELDMAAILDSRPPHAWKLLLLRFKRFDHKFCLTLIQWVIFFFFIQEDQDRRMSKQNLDMIRNTAGDLHAKYYSSIMKFVQQKWMPAGIIMEARGIPAEAAAWSSLNCRY